MVYAAAAIEIRLQLGRFRLYLLLHVRTVGAYCESEEKKGVLYFRVSALLKLYYFTLLNFCIGAMYVLEEEYSCGS